MVKVLRDIYMMGTLQSVGYKYNVVLIDDDDDVLQ